MTRDFIRTYGQRQIAGVNLVGAPALLGGKAMPFIWAGFLEHAPGACARPGDEHCGDALVRPCALCKADASSDRCKT
jgi:hypothetical protein